MRREPRRCGQHARKPTGQGRRRWPRRCKPGRAARRLRRISARERHVVMPEHANSMHAKPPAKNSRRQEHGQRAKKCEREKGEETESTQYGRSTHLCVGSLERSAAKDITSMSTAGSNALHLTECRVRRQRRKRRQGSARVTVLVRYRGHPATRRPEYRARKHTARLPGRPTPRRSVRKVSETRRVRHEHFRGAQHRAHRTERFKHSDTSAGRWGGARSLGTQCGRAARLRVYVSG
ncbi:hypothetical protein C8R47DRAFT_1163775 [Mycena vitilis]|nr:hypothetical protein C8R47DRAFT_1163775 [Mycena vitilis]